MKIHHDSPAKIDLLNRKQFAQEIAENISSNFKNNHESIVFGLNGAWGSGKSTLLRFLKNELEIKLKEKKQNS